MGVTLRMYMTPMLMPRPEARLSHILPARARSRLKCHQEAKEKKASMSRKCMIAVGEVKATRAQARMARAVWRAKNFEEMLLVGRKPMKMVAEAVATARMRLRGKASIRFPV